MYVAAQNSIAGLVHRICSTTFRAGNGDRIADRLGILLDDLRRLSTKTFSRQDGGKYRFPYPAMSSMVKETRCGSKHRSAYKGKVDQISMTSVLLGSLILFINCAACIIGLTFVCSTINVNAALIC